MSKYNIGVQKIRELSESELNKFIRNGVKVINSKYKRMKNLGTASKFSEYVKDFEELSSRFYGENKNFSSAVKGKTLEEKRLVAYAINNLTQISETPARVKREFKDNIESKFLKDVEETQEILNALTSDELVGMVRDNFNLIYDILGSDRVHQIALEYGEDNTAFYEQCIIEATKTMENYYDESEIDKILEEWVYPEGFNE